MVGSVVKLLNQIPGHLCKWNDPINCNKLVSLLIYLEFERSFKVEEMKHL